MFIHKQRQLQKFVQQNNVQKQEKCMLTNMSIGINCIKKPKNTLNIFQKKNSCFSDSIYLSIVFTGEPYTFLKNLDIFERCGTKKIFSFIT